MIRRAKKEDWEALIPLLDELGYKGAGRFLETRLASMIEDHEEVLLVYEEDKKILAFVSLHFIPQVALEGDFARISYLSVSPSAQNRGIGREMEAWCTRLALERGCDRLELHSHNRRVDAHRFYKRLGYEESPKYFIKRLK